jgi:hypothetical protein
MLISSGVIVLVISGIAFANRHIRHIETEIPDIVIETDEEAPTPAQLSPEVESA